MKNKNNAIANFGRIMLVLCLLIAVGCKDDDAFNEHYEQLDSRLGSNILSILSEDPDYSTFVKYLKQTGYSSQLATAQAYTVWAPNNAAFTQVPAQVISNPDLLKELIGNHISLFSYNTSSNQETLVKMFNNKYVEFINNGGASSFGDVNVVDADILASNGILHTLDEVLLVNPNIWGYLNENTDQFPILMDFLTQFNETGFDEANSVPTGRNSLGQTVYDSIFSTTNSYFKTIGDLSLEENRFTFIGLTDDLYADVYDDIDDYYNFPAPDTVRKYTDQSIFRNLNFPLVEPSDLNGTPITSTTGGEILIDPNTIIENVSLSNGNLLALNQLDFDGSELVHKPIRYEIENTNRRTLGSLTDFSVQKKYDAFASGNFTNVVRLVANPDGSDSNNYFEIAFGNVLSAGYKVNLKFTPVGAPQDTKLKFEIKYIGSDFRPVIVEVPPIIVSNLEDGVITIGADSYDLPFYVSEMSDNYFHMILRVIVDVSEPELILYDRMFGIDYAELVPTE